MQQYVRKVLIISSLIVALVTFFTLNLTVFPNQYLSQPVDNPQPIQTVTISNERITLGKSFIIEVVAENKNDVADILITSVAFPTLQEIDNNTKIIGFDYTQSPTFIKIGDKINSGYTGGGLISAKYPSIESYSRNVSPNSSYHIDIRVTPTTTGSFDVYVKTIAIPHTSDLSHYPHQGLTDAQGELVEVHRIMVNP